MGLIGSALGAAGSIFGGISASKAMKKAKKNVQEQMQKNQDWYDRRYNEDATQRADAQRILTMTEESIKNRNKQAAGTQAVMGGTDESTAAVKAANNQALEQRKDQIEQQYLQRDADLNEQLKQLEMGRAQAISGAVQGVTQAASSIPF